MAGNKIQHDGKKCSHHEIYMSVRSLSVGRWENFWFVCSNLCGLWLILWETAVEWVSEISLKELLCIHELLIKKVKYTIANNLNIWYMIENPFLHFLCDEKKRIARSNIFDVWMVDYAGGENNKKQVKWRQTNNTYFSSVQKKNEH